MTIHRPIPIHDAVNEGFWESADHGRLSIPRCQECGTYLFPPIPECWNCKSSHIRFEVVSGKARLVSWTEVSQPIVGGFEEAIPFTCLVVELIEQEGLFLVSDFPGPIGQIPGGVWFGRDMYAVFEKVSETNFMLPQFRPLENPNSAIGDAKGGAV